MNNYQIIKVHVVTYIKISGGKERSTFAQARYFSNLRYLYFIPTPLSTSLHLRREILYFLLHYIYLNAVVTLQNSDFSQKKLICNYFDNQ